MNSRFIHPKHFNYRVWHSASLGSVEWRSMTDEHIRNAIGYIHRRVREHEEKQVCHFGNLAFEYPTSPWTLSVANDLSRYLSWRIDTYGPFSESCARTSTGPLSSADAYPCGCARVSHDYLG